MKGPIRAAILVALGLVAGGCAGAAGPGGGGAATPAGNTVTGTLQDAQSLSGQEIVRLTIRHDDGRLEPMDVDDPSLPGGGLSPAEVRARVGKRVTVEFREEGGARIALRVTDAAP